VGYATSGIHVARRQGEQLGLTHGRLKCEFGERREEGAVRPQSGEEALFFVTDKSAIARLPPVG